MISNVRINNNSISTEFQDCRLNLRIESPSTSPNFARKSNNSRNIPHSTGNNPVTVSFSLLQLYFPSFYFIKLYPGYLVLHFPCIWGLCTCTDQELCTCADQGLCTCTDQQVYSTVSPDTASFLHFYRNKQWG